MINSQVEFSMSINQCINFLFSESHKFTIIIEYRCQSRDRIQVKAGS